ncbi:MAG: uroporphyrinogen decarboxylase family protein [Candidatus Bathyarchaeia archaeon]
MKPRDRCISSILLEEPDRVPLILRIRPEPYERLKSLLGFKNHMGLGRHLGIDIVGTYIGVRGGYLPEGVEVKEGPYGPAYTIGEYMGFEVRRDVWGIESIWCPDRTYTYTYHRHPLQSIQLEDYVWPEVDEYGFDRVLKVRRIYEDYCLYGSVEHMWEIAWQLIGFKETMKMIYTRIDYLDRVLDGLQKIRLRQAKLLCEAGVDVVYDGDDVGMQRGMMISPGVWRRLLKPRYRELADLCHRYGVFFNFHSDGWIEPIIPDLIEIGVDILNPVQPECMDPVKLKQIYGDKLCFDGTIGVQSTLPFGSAEDVAEGVVDRIARLGPTGLILGPTHSIQPDTPIENILTL